MTRHTKYWIPSIYGPSPLHSYVLYLEPFIYFRHFEIFELAAREIIGKRLSDILQYFFIHNVLLCIKQRR